MVLGLYDGMAKDVCTEPSAKPMLALGPASCVACPLLIWSGVMTVGQVLLDVGRLLE